MDTKRFLRSPVTTALSEHEVVVLFDFTVNTRYGPITVPSGFTYDEATVPYLGEVLLHLDGHDPRLRGPSCVHDYLYRSGDLTRAQADTVYRDLARSNGIDVVRANIHRTVLRLTGWYAWNKHRKAELSR